jgi:hypothetical protein
VIEALMNSSKEFPRFKASSEFSVVGFYDAFKKEIL